MTPTQKRTKAGEFPETGPSAARRGRWLRQALLMLLLAGLAGVGAPAARALPPGRDVAGGGDLIVTWRVPPPAAALSRGRLSAEAAGLSATGLLELTPFFAGHTAADDPLARFWLARPAAGRDPLVVAAALARDARILAVDQDIVTPLSASRPDDPYFAHADPDSAQWTLHDNPTGPDLHALDAWNVTPGDSGAVVAVIDSGIDWRHPEFGAWPGAGSAIVTNWPEWNGRPGVDDDGNGFVDDVRGWDFVSLDTIAGELARVAPAEDALTPDNDPDDYDGHGTFVAGIIAARADDGRGIAGAAPGCRVMPLRAGWRQDYIDTNSGRRIVRGVISETFCAQAIVYAADNGARVLNCSWLSDSLAVLKAAMDYAVGQKHVVAVVAAGNTGRDTNQRLNYLSRRNDCIDVAAVDRSGIICAVSATGLWVDLSAPGQLILSTVPTFFGHDYSLYRDGATSWAAPYGAAAAALLLAAEPGLTPEAVRQRLMTTATNVDSLQGLWAGLVGAGVIQMAAALHAEQVNPVRALGARPATPPAWLGDGRAVFTTAGGKLVRVEPYSGSVDSMALPITGPLGGVAYRPGDGALTLTYERGQVGWLNGDGRSRPGWPRPIGGLAHGGPVFGSGDAALLVAGSDSTLYAWREDGAPVGGYPARLPDAALASPAFGDVTGDGAPDAVVICRDGSVALLDAQGRSPAGWPAPAHASGDLSPLLGDLDGDGRLDVVVPEASGRLTTLSPGGAVRSGWPRLTGAPIVGEPALADLDGDGSAEIVVALADRRVLVYAGDGSARAGFPVTLKEDPAAGPIAAPLGVSAPNRVDLVIATRSGGLIGLDGAGRPVAGWPKRTAGEFDGPPVFLAGGGPRPAYCAAIDTSGRLWLFAVPSLLDAARPGWSTFAGNPERTRALAATRPVAPGPDPGAGPPVLHFAPNPFAQGATTARLSLTRAGRVRGDILDVQGRHVRRLLDEFRPAGELTVAWDGRDDAGVAVSSGVYLYRLELPGARAEGRLVRVR